MLKSKADIEQIKKLGAISKELMALLVKNTKPGIMSVVLNDIASAFLRERHVSSAFRGFGGFPKEICVSINNTAVHGIPDTYLLKEGDLVSLDVGVRKGRYCTDAAFSAVAGTPTPQTSFLIETNLRALEAGIDATKVGNKISDIAIAMEGVVKAANLELVKGWSLGHGTGFEVHEQPKILPTNFIPIEEGMVLAIEPILTNGTTCCCFEHTVAVVGGIAEVLT